MLAPGSLAIVACLAAALWAPPAMAQTITDLGTLGGSSSGATGINASGEVVGYSTTAGGAAFTLTVTGTNFIAPAKVYWNGAALQTIPGSGITTLSAVVPATDIETAGTASVTVKAAGGTSAAAQFYVYPKPTITSLSPPSATAGGAAFTLTINGANFRSGAKAWWNLATLHTTFVSATKLTAAVPAADIAKATTASVYVVNPGGSYSWTTSFVVK